MRYLLDSNSCIFLLGHGHDALKERVLASVRGDIGISSIAFAEVALGSWNGKRPPLHILDGLTREIEVLPFDLGAARQYAMLPFRRANFDRLIAAHALSLGLTLVTANEADLGKIPGLKFENWDQ